MIPRNDPDGELSRGDRIAALLLFDDIGMGFRSSPRGSRPVATEDVAPSVPKASPSVVLLFLRRMGLR